MNTKTLYRAVIAALAAAVALQPILADSPERAATGDKPAAPTCPGGDDPKGKEVPEPKPEQAVTRHRVTIGGSSASSGRS